jgi:hypothetical protein
MNSNRLAIEAGDVLCGKVGQKGKIDQGGGRGNKFGRNKEKGK